MSKIVSPFLLLLLSVFNPVKIWGQNVPAPPDCVLFINFLPSGSGFATGGFDNRTIGCQTWTLSYQATAQSGTITALSFQYSESPLGTQPNPGTYTNFTGADQVVTGINPNTSNTGAVTVFQNNAPGDTTTVPASWVRVVLTGSFAGVLNGVVYGYRSGYTGSGAAGSGCPNPCPVIGTTNPGSAVANAPVQIGLSDGTNVRRALGDTGGRPIVVGPAANGASVVGNPLMTAKLDGTGALVRSDFTCTSQAAIILAAGTNVVVVAGTAMTTIRVCHISFSMDATANIILRQGSGTTCGSSTTNLTGAYQNVTGLALDFTEIAPLVAGTGLDLCINSSGSVTLGGVVTYAQF